jgi:hypothetical protein
VPACGDRGVVFGPGAALRLVPRRVSPAPARPGRERRAAPAPR